MKNFLHRFIKVVSTFFYVTSNLVRHEVKKSDLWWILLYPLYQIIGTARHELAHAVVAILEGAKITEIVIWPTIHEGRFLWGYVHYQGGNITWLTIAAPYVCDLLTFSLTFWFCTKVRICRKWVWINLIIIGMMSPLLNSAYQYVKGIFMLPGDVNFILIVFGDKFLFIHLYFIFTIFLYLFGLYYMFFSDIENR